MSANHNNDFLFTVDSLFWLLNINTNKQWRYEKRKYVQWCSLRLRRCAYLRGYGPAFLFDAMSAARQPLYL
jgi:hypothetical protein